MHQGNPTGILLVRVSMVPVTRLRVSGFGAFSSHVLHGGDSAAVPRRCLENFSSLCAPGLEAALLGSLNAAHAGRS